MSSQLGPGASLGITWGGTINAAAQNIRSRRGQGNTVVLLCGGLARSTAINPYDNAAMFARALDATCYYVTAPMFADTADLRKLLMASDPVREVLQKTRRLDMALLSAVDLSRESHALEYGVISRDTWRSLRTAGAVGDICGHYLDVEGAVVDHPIARRTINPPLRRPAGGQGARAGGWRRAQGPDHSRRHPRQALPHPDHRRGGGSGAAATRRSG